MKNKENGNRRPCYFCFNDSDNPEIIWFVPISSKVDKYKKLYDDKKKKYKDKNGNIYLKQIQAFEKIVNSGKTNYKMANRAVQVQQVVDEVYKQN